MRNDFTSAQKDAVESTGSIIVSAAAGSGKTTVLVERVMNIITKPENPTPIDKLLIVTFTNSAAAEMKARIEQALYERIKNEPENEHLKEQKYLIGSADICTIDSFCAGFVRENFSLLGITPDFSVSTGDDLAEKRARLLDDLLEPHFKEHSPAFDMALQLTNCEYDETNLCTLVLELFNEAMQRPDMDAFFESLIAPYRCEFNVGNKYYDMALQKAREYVSVLKTEAAELLDNAELIEGKNQEQIEYAETVSGAIDILEYSLSKGYDDFSEKLRESDFKRTIRKGNDCEAKKIFGAIKNDIIKRIDELKDCFLYSVDKTEKIRQKVLPAVELIIDLCRQLFDKYYEFCKEENVLTVNLCEQLTYQLLMGKMGGEGLVKKEYAEVMVDEYQDVNNLQDAIFTSLSNGGKNLFVVGDIKQSIYAFRGSNPENFIEKEKTQEKNIFLSENFRSRKEICSAVNFFFSNLLNGEIGSIVYGEKESLKPGGEFPETQNKPVEMLIVDNSEKELSRFEAESEAIADYIEEIMKSGDIVTTKDKKLRPAKYEDIAILMRALTKVDTIAGALQKRGIPVTFSGEAFINTYEIRLIKALLIVINNPKNDVELATVMLSPLFDFTADDLARMRTGNNKCSVYKSIINAANAGDIKSENFLKTFDEYRRIFFTNTFGDAINNLYTVTGITDIVSLLPGGDAKVSNLRYFAKLAADYSAVSTGGIYAFLNYLSELPEKFFKTGTTGEAGVKIITMHKSKGLQFPICILANLESRLRHDDYSNKILYTDELGIGFKYFDDEFDDICFTPNYKGISEYKKAKRSEEELRILYVAATRAQDKLCLAISLDSPKKSLEKIIEKLEPEPQFIGRKTLTSVSSLADFFLYAAVLNSSFKPVLQRYGKDAPGTVGDCGLNPRVVTASPREEEEQSEEIKPLENAELENQMLKNFEYKYPFETLSRIESKVSVSRLANGEEAERFAFTSKPSFMIEGGMTAAETGTALHHVMQYISFEEGINVESEIERLKEWRYITEAEADAVSIPAISKFFESDIFKAIKRSSDVRREMRFLTEVPVTDIDPEADVPKGTGVLIQGAVDLCFTENDSVTVLDFKTDRVDDMETFKDRYFEQLSIYSKACEKIFALPVKKRIVYSFHLSDYIVF